jgi:hypothetical protein
MTTRRKWLAGLFGLLPTLAVASVVNKAPAQVLHAGDPGTGNIEVYRRSTGKKVHLVRSLCVDEGWADVYVPKSAPVIWRIGNDGKPCASVDEYTPEIVRIYGDFAIRQRTPTPKPITIFNYERVARPSRSFLY